ncbi:MAG: class I SAM-dependent methyltransferase [Lentisphaerae bacterium]|mgnify:FL=1|nr:class I SAM-dependent methyltransferase [Lentisphaerota bacterium]
MKMRIADIVNRCPEPLPWAEGDNIPWNDPDFSRRMLDEHLTQGHDAASRRLALVDHHIAWIHDVLLDERPSSILDLGCGPGLYLERLAARGHTCTGVDYSPASIAYARKKAGDSGWDIDYREGDLREVEYPRDRTLVMQIFGEMNVFRRSDAASILGRACGALVPGGRVLLEVHEYDTIKGLGSEGASWFSSPSDLFGDDPHLVLTESHWDSKTATTTIRYHIIDAASGAVDRYAQTFQAYTDPEYTALLVEAGFGNIRLIRDVPGWWPPGPRQLFLLVGEKMS